MTLSTVIEPGEANTTCRFEYGVEEGSYPTSVACSEELSGSAGQSQSVHVEGLEANRIYHYRVSATNEVGTSSGPDQTFTTGPVKPAAATGPASGVLRTEAQLSGEVNPENSETFYYFQYGPTEAYGSSTPVTATPPHFGLLALPTVRIGELKAGNVYHYRLVASNTAGVTLGADRTLTTPPAQPPSLAAGSVAVGSPTTATITIPVNPNGLPTSYTLQLGTDTSYGTLLFGRIIPARETLALEIPLTGLQPGGTYHYRLGVSNQDAAITGPDETFTTPGFPQSITQPPTPLLIATPPFPNTQTTAPRPGKPKSTKKKHKKRGKGKKKAAKSGRHGRKHR